jgi:hypothetical protein
MNTPVKSDESAARYCNCADPENCVEQIPGRLCKRLILPPIPVKSEAPYRLHRSDCAVHNEPAELTGECSCALLDEQDADYRLTVEFHNFPMGASLYVQESWNDGSGHTMTFDRATFDKVCEFAQSFGWNSHSALLAQISELQAENQALRNLANNLQPGPISEALAGTRYARESELAKALVDVRPHLEKGARDIGDPFTHCVSIIDAALSGVTK